MRAVLQIGHAARRGWCLMATPPDEVGGRSLAMQPDGRVPRSGGAREAWSRGDEEACVGRLREEGVRVR